MTTFNSSQHPRGHGGKFAATQHAENPELAGDPTPKTWEQQVEHGLRVAQDRGIDLEPIADILRRECPDGITSDQAEWARITIEHGFEFRVDGSDLWAHTRFDPGHESDADDVLIAALDHAWTDQ